MNYQQSTLPNGLRIIAVPMASVQSVTVMVLVGVGSRYEEKDINGISHFLEHMAFKGTQKRPDALAISSAIDGVGGEFNAFTSKDHTGYYVKAAVNHMELLVDLLSDMLLHSKFDSEEIEKERGVIIEEINMYEDTPMRKVGDLFENLLYGDTKLGRDISGRKEVIKSVKRKDFIDYIDRFYGPANSLVVIAGGIGNGNVKDFAGIQALVGNYLGNWNNKSVVGPELVSDIQTEPALLVKFKDTQQAHLCIGYRSYYLGHPKRYTLAVLSAILGGGMSSRLFTEVREKRGLAYYVRSDNEQYKEVGNFVTQAGADVNRIDDVIKVMIEEFNKIASKPVTKEELLKAKEYLKGRLTLELEDSRSVASLFGVSELLEGVIRTPLDIMQGIDKVTIEEVQDTAKEIFKHETLNLAIIGPYKEEERFKSIIKFSI